MANKDTKQTSESNYKLSLTGEGVTVERTISESVARRITTLVLGGMTKEPQSPEEFHGVDSTIVDGASPKVFMSAKRPMSDIERITCLAYYLTHYRGKQHFKTKELSDLNTEAAQPKFSNATVAARNAVQKEFLSLVGGTKKQITVRGEALVDALPDRNRVKAALDATPARKRRVARGALKARK